jgi:hypothetical protein
MNKMRLDLRKGKFVFAVIFGWLLFLPSNMSGQLSKNDYEMIRMAFLNGYVRALNLDIEKIKYLKGKADDLKRFVLAEAEEYMKEVSRLNR